MAFPYPANQLKAVETLAKGGLAVFTDYYPYNKMSNGRWKGFPDFGSFQPDQRGITGFFDIPYRTRTKPGLNVTTFDNVRQRTIPITVELKRHKAVPMTIDELIAYDMKHFKTSVQAAIMQGFAGEMEQFLVKKVKKAAYRFYGNGKDKIDSYLQMATGMSRANEYGIAPTMRQYVPHLAVPGIVNSGLKDFTGKRNEKTGQTWQLPDMMKCSMFESNITDQHICGKVGESEYILKISSAPMSGNVITQLICDEVSRDGGATFEAIVVDDTINAFDPLFILDATGLPRVRQVNNSTYLPTQLPVQFMPDVDASFDAGSLTINVSPGLVYDDTSDDQNITAALTPGMLIKSVKSFQLGCINTSNSIFRFTPPLPSTDPFMSFTAQEPDSGISVRGRMATDYASGQQSYIYDFYAGGEVLGEHTKKILYPLEGSIVI